MTSEMTSEFKLSYTANEINEKLGKIDSLATSEYVNFALATKQPVGDYALKSDIPAASTGGGAILDVTELPAENIMKDVFYRLTSGYLVFNRNNNETYTVHLVESLPETGLPATNIDQTEGHVYYTVNDGEAYGYVDEVLSVGLSVPSGWYPGATLIGALGYEYKGVITDINDDPCDDSFRLLLSKDYYIYQDGWCEVPFAYEKRPEFDIRWDGVIGDRVALDTSPLGFAEGMYFVKVSDDVFTTDEVIGGTMQRYYLDTGYSEKDVITSDVIDTTSYPGAFAINNCIVVMHSEDDLATALGIPTGIYTNGVYFWTYVGDAYPDDKGYVSSFAAPPKVIKIDEKYLPEISVDSLGLHSVATTGNYNDLRNRPTVHTDVIRYTVTQSLSSSQKQNARKNIDVYSRSDVDSMIANAGTGADLSAYSTTTEVEIMISSAIGTAIGGEY